MKRTLVTYRPSPKRASWLATLGAAAGLMLLIGCGPHGAPTVPGPQSADVPPSLPFLDLVADAPFKVAYGGTRHVYVNYTLNQVAMTMDYTEQVFSNGTGKFTVIPSTVISPPMNTHNLEWFKLLQGKREGFFYRYRDFRIHDLGLFQQNYVTTDLGAPITVCGRVCAWLELHHVSGGQSYYRAAIDPTNGLIMRCDEFDNSGQMLSRVEFTDFTLTPDLSGVAFHSDIAAEPLDLSVDTTAQLGFQVVTPTLLPTNFQLAKAEKINDGEHNWARIGYSDGAEQLFFLQSIVGGNQGPGQHGLNPGAGAEAPKREVRVFHLGPWTVAQGFINQRRLVVMGKTDEATVLDMLQSALH